MERGLSFEDLKLDGEGTFCLKVSSWMRGGFLLEGFKLDERGLSFEDLKLDERGLSA